MSKWFGHTPGWRIPPQCFEKIERGVNRSMRVRMLRDDLEFLRLMLLVERRGEPRLTILRDVASRTRQIPFYVSFRLKLALERWHDRYEELQPTPEERREILGRRIAV